MCLYPRLILNPKYRKTKKNGGNIPAITDQRVKYVPIGCQRCMECRKQKSRNWQVRLLEDIKTNNNGKFVTLTLSNEAYANISNEIKDLDGYDRDNEIARIAVRRFVENHRAKYGKSIRHWLITELGHQGTQNIHLHGIVWIDNLEQLKTWTHGYVWKGKKVLQHMGKYTREHFQNYVNEKTVGYITKYVTKIDELHKTYEAKIFTSPGIGNSYTRTHDARNNTFQDKNTNETYRTRSGHKIALPIYYRNKIYTEQQREKLWLNKLDKQERWINGERISIKNGEQTYWKALKWHQERNIRLGYGSDLKNWDRVQYERELRNTKHKERISKAKFKRYRNLSKTSTNAQLFKGKYTRLWYASTKGIAEFKIEDWTIRQARLLTRSA